MIRSLCYVCAGLVAAACASFAQSIPLPQYPVGVQPSGIAAGDFTSDGASDLVVANEYSNNVSFLIASAGGGFFSARDVRIGGGQGPVAIASADFDGDGNLDFAVVNTASEDVTILAGDGAGNFRVTGWLVTQAAPIALAIADFDNNAALDIAVANSGRSSISVFLGTGGGRFGPPYHYPAGEQPWSVAVSDVNIDGALDVLAANRMSNEISVLLGNGAGGFSTAPSTALVAAPISIDVRDLTGDAIPDAFVVVDNYGVYNLWHCVGDGSAGFGPCYIYYTGLHAKALAMEDLNNDSMVDAVVASTSANAARHYCGQTWGGFGCGSALDTGLDPIGIVLSDLTNDGLGDIAVTNAGSDSVTVIYGAGGFLFTKPPAFVVDSEPSALAVADYNLDGYPDAATACTFGQSMTVNLGNAAGGFGNKTLWSAGPEPRSVAAGDINNDQVMDIVHVGGFLARVLLGIGNGYFAAQARFYWNARDFSAVALGDVDFDGKLDAVAADKGLQVIDIFKGDGAGSFVLSSSHSTGFGTATTASPVSLALADVNGDGAIDAATGNVGVALLSNDSLSIFTNRAGSAGVFSLTFLSSFGTSHDAPLGLSASDVDADGDVDIVVGQESGIIRIYKGDGGGWFEPFEFYQQSEIASATIGDMNRDGLADIVTSGGNNNTASILINNGSSGFAEPIYFAAGNRPVHTAICDFGVDGDTDILAVCHDSYSVAMLVNSVSAPAGVGTYGTGTPGCYGFVGAGANSLPQVNNPDFALDFTDAPPSALGVAFATDVGDVSGSDLLSIDLLFHVGFAGASEILTFELLSDPSGAGAAYAPIPNDPTLAGSRYYVQALFAESGGFACSAAALPLVSSRGLTFIIYP